MWSTNQLNLFMPKKLLSQKHIIIKKRMHETFIFFLNEYLSNLNKSHWSYLEITSEKVGKGLDLLKITFL